MGFTLVATIWEPGPILRAMSKYNIDKIILVREEEDLADSRSQSKKEDSIDIVRNSIQVEEIKTGLNDVYRVASDVFEDLKNSEDQLIFDVTGGKKPQALGLIMAASRLPNVEEIIYDAAEDNQFLNIPMFNLEVSEKRKKILRLIEDGKEPKGIEEELDLSQSMVYNHLNELVAGKYLKKTEDGWIVTDVGRFVIQE